MNVWTRAQSVQIQVSEKILPGFNIGFDKEIPSETEKELRSFVSWVESRYRMPVTLWVDFAYRHYLVRRDGKRVGYLFFWADWADYPVFDDPEKLPEIRLAVRTEKSTMEEILTSFIEAISDYFAWICNELHEEYETDETVVEEILQEYLYSRHRIEQQAK